MPNACHQQGIFVNLHCPRSLICHWKRDSVRAPCHHRMLDNCVCILNTIVSPRIQRSNRRFRDRVYMLWTRMSGPLPHLQGKTWLSNHFVPLIGKDQVPGVKPSTPIGVEDVSSPVKVTIKSLLQFQKVLKRTLTF